MSDRDETWQTVETVALDFVRAQKVEVEQRWKSWTLDPVSPEKNEVVGSLLARQATLASGLAQSPGFWNLDLGSLVLRAMYELHITVAWILKSPDERAKKFIEFGLGQEKLILEHIKSPPPGYDSPDERTMKGLESWLNSQKFSWLTVVNVGAWADTSFRKMADEAGLADHYRMKYVPMSSNTHSMWNYVGKYNLRRCENPLHRYHRIPRVVAVETDIRILLDAAALADETFRLTDAWSPTADWKSAFQELERQMDEAGRRLADAPESPVEPDAIAEGDVAPGDGTSGGG